MRRVSVQEFVSQDPDEQYHQDRILNEHMELRKDNPSPYLYVSGRDDDQMHLEAHRDLISRNTLTPQADSALKNHIEDHKLQADEKDKLGIVNPPYEDSNRATSDSAPLVALTTTPVNS